MKRKSSEAAKKDAGGDEKLIIKFAWPNNYNCYNNFYSHGESHAKTSCTIEDPMLI